MSKDTKDKSVFSKEDLDYAVNSIIENQSKMKINDETRDNIIKVLNEAYEERKQ